VPNRIQAFYRDHPRMVSSPFGGIHDFDAALLHRVWQQLGIQANGARVLDVGCGRGYAREAVEALAARYTGADFVITRAGFPLAQADAHHLPFPPAAFDIVMCVDAFEHFPDPLVASREFCRVLKPGGVFFLSAPNYGNVAGLVKRWCESRGTYEPNTWAPFGRWQPQELEQPLTGPYLKRLMRQAGFDETKRIGFGREVELGLFPWIDHPRMPDRVRLRLQPVIRALGPGIAAVWPGASLHSFWKFGK